MIIDMQNLVVISQTACTHGPKNLGWGMAYALETCYSSTFVVLTQNSVALGQIVRT